MKDKPVFTGEDFRFTTKGDDMFAIALERRPSPS
jgi:hypothetical protein